MEIEVAGRKAHIYTGGKSLAHEEIAAQPVVVFIHGAQQDHSCWTLQSRWFAHHGFAVLAPDLPGHGRSEGEALASVEALADWVVALLDALGVARATLVGHSMGSLVALEAATRHPARVSQVALIGTALPMPVSDVLLEAARDDEPKAVAMVNDWSYSPTGQIGGSAVPGLWLQGMNRRLMERQKRGVFHADLAACQAYARPPESLAAVAAPVLIVAGSRDRMTPTKAAKALAASLPAARLVVVEGSGHALMAEKPDAILDALRQFVVAGS